MLLAILATATTIRSQMQFQFRFRASCSQLLCERLKFCQQEVKVVTSRHRIAGDKSEEVRQRT